MTDQAGSAQTLFLQKTHLVIHWPDGSEQTYPLSKEITAIGRGAEGNNLVIPAEFSSVANQQLEIRKQGNTYVAVARGGGVLWNRKRISDVVLLADGDELRIGAAETGQQIILVFKAGVEALLQEAIASATVVESVGFLPAAPSDAPYLAVRWPAGNTSYYPIRKDVSLAGRAANADLRIPPALTFVSQRHFEIHRTGGEFTIQDLNSTNGTYLNNVRLTSGRPLPLRHNMVVRIGNDEFGVSVGFVFQNPAMAGGLGEGFQAGAATQLPRNLAFTIGRSPDCNIVLDHPEVSRTHARILQLGDTFILEDRRSLNGTFLNGQRIERAELHEGDLIQILNFMLVFRDGQVVQYQSTGMRVDVENLNQDVRARGGSQRILEDISLTVLPREFVAVVGSSGAGKTTLLNALIGYRPGKGKVRLNGRDFYAEYEKYRSQLGFVPQNDILHMTLTVEKALDYAARLRLPGNLSKKERQERITGVLETVSMNTPTIRKTRIGSLSGGQRKRVSIAAELLADPKLIYLDEATSGLDPGLEKKLMYTLRRMADEGRTIILITHATSNIVQTDHVAFLSQGRLIYFGPSQETLDFFEVEEFADIYERIERNGAEWEQIFRNKKPEHYQKYVLGRRSTLRAVPEQAAPKARYGAGDFLRQLWVLAQRNFNVLLSDPLTLALMLLLFPVTALLQLVIAKTDVLTGNLAILADPVAAAKTMLSSYIPLADTNTFVFVMGLEAVLVGLYVPPNELIRERSIYLRERTVNLKMLPYLLSKVLIYAIFAAIQVALYLLILSIGVDFPKQGLLMPGASELFITLFLTMMAGIGIGMVVAAVSRSTDMAIYILVMLLFFQFFFAGTIFDLRGNNFEPLSYLATTRWSLNAIGVTIDMEKLAESTVLCNRAPENPLDPQSATKTVCFNYPEARDDLMLSYKAEKLTQSWLVLAGMALLSICVTGILLQRMNAAT